MKKLILAAAITSVFASAFAQAPEAKPEEKKPDNELSFNLGATSDYRYRGISQSRLQPALQGGADLVNNPTGLYVGTWASSIKWIKDSGGNGHAEIDLYAGKKGDIGKGFGYDVGGLYYLYPNNKLDSVSGYKNADTFELYGKLTYGIAYVKYSSAMTNLFGTPNSKNSGYVDVGADIDLGKGYTLNLHGGYQHVMHSPNLSYSDYKIAVTKQFFGVDFNLAAITTDSKAYVYGTNNLGKTSFVLTATKTF